MIIVADSVLMGFINIKDGLVLDESYVLLVCPSVGMVVRAGAPTVDTLRQMLVQAESIAYSASVVGQHVTKELYQRLGIADEVMGKNQLIGGGKQVGAVIVRGKVNIRFRA